MNCIDCRYGLIRDGYYNCTYEEGDCIKISVLEKENLELKEHHKSVCDTLTNTHRHLGERLAEAKEIIKSFIDDWESVDGEQVRKLTIVKEAEQFLKEV